MDEDKHKYISRAELEEAFPEMGMCGLWREMPSCILKRGHAGDHCDRMLGRFTDEEYPQHGRAPPPLRPGEG